jgi:hypothetical protein
MSVELIWSYGGIIVNDNMTREGPCAGIKSVSKPLSPQIML